MEKQDQNAPPPPYPQGSAPPPGGAPPPQGYSQPGGPAYGQQGAGYPPPPAPGYGNTVVHQPGASTTVYVNAPMRFTEAPMVMQCPHCQANITTTVNYENGTMTWLVMGGICLVGCWLGCCLIPLCVNSLKDAKHTCPNCNRLLGTCNRM